MNIKPLGDRVVLKAIEREQKTESGIVLPDSAKKEKPMEGEIVAVGEGRLEDGERIEPAVKVGDQVIYSKYAGTEVKVDGKEFLILSEKDVLAIID